MANGRRPSSSNRSRNSKSNTSRNNSRSGSNRNNSRSKSAPLDVAIRNEIYMILYFAVAVLLFLCNFKILGTVGNFVSNIMFGIFGYLAYIAPLLFFLAIAFGLSNAGNKIATRKIVAGVLLFIIIDMSFELLGDDLDLMTSYSFKDIYLRCAENHKGGGVIAGSIAYLINSKLNLVGSVLILCVIAIICIIIITEKSFVSGVREGSRRIREQSAENADYRRERAIERQEIKEQRMREREERRALLEEKALRADENRAKNQRERNARKEESENEKILRMDKKVSGVMIDTALGKNDKEPQPTKISDDVHEIMLNTDDIDAETVISPVKKSSSHFISNTNDELTDVHIHGDFGDEEVIDSSSVIADPEPESILSPRKKTVSNDRTSARKTIDAEPLPVSKPITHEPANNTVKKKAKKYQFPPLSLLRDNPKKASGSSKGDLYETAKLLEQTLSTFGVNAKVTDISQGPAVTRYELQPEVGVKVSKIVGLADDIKLNLAATDIRIEAPIPGKAAVGIEVPNKENSAVYLKDLLSSSEFKNFNSKLSFAVGKDLSGKIQVTDIGKMPHMLIAGATGSGKSVCINTIIMSILYKARPDEVKLIMVDPKVVELSCYNGIPHLLIPVVTDPKKAAAALHWAVAEMTDRYKKFAESEVRDLAGYNRKLEEEAAPGEPVEKLPQILVIVDELADLMMVAANEVEESICRLAQLARAAGIHLIIATQRPSVDVITGLIKANMPSRVAFAVSSQVDSRTILDMGGAEKLLGKGDMLFYPQGYPKPARIQGAFVSDEEVASVVSFLKDQSGDDVYDDTIAEKINSANSDSSSGGFGDSSGSDYDTYFAEAGRFIIEKDKASIGMLQRMFKIGFNRAARIMDQLCECGVVGEEEGTKPRKILMSEAEFEQLLEELPL